MYVSVSLSPSLPSSVIAICVSSATGTVWAFAVGTSSTEAMSTVTVAADESTAPSFTLNEKLTYPIPFALATGTKITRRDESVTVVGTLAICDPNVAPSLV